MFASSIILLYSILRECLETVESRPCAAGSIHESVDARNSCGLVAAGQAVG